MAMFLEVFFDHTCVFPPSLWVLFNLLVHACLCFSLISSAFLSC